jgi:hypothetical protein
MKRINMAFQVMAVTISATLFLSAGGRQTVHETSHDTEKCLWVSSNLDSNYYVNSNQSINNQSSRLNTILEIGRRCRNGGRWVS